MRRKEDPEVEGGAADEGDDGDATPLLSWPVVPAELRPRPLYVNYAVPQRATETLAERGWTVTDVRLMSDRGKAIEGTLEGARVGSINLSERLYKFIELEARTLGMVGTKDRPPEEGPKKHSFESLLTSFGSPQTTITMALPSAPAGMPPEVPRQPGRPLGSGDKKPRIVTRKRLRGASLQRTVTKLEKQGRFEAAAKVKEDNE